MPMVEIKEAEVPSPMEKGDDMATDKLIIGANSGVENIDIADVGVVALLIVGDAAIIGEGAGENRFENLENRPKNREKIGEKQAKIG
uniref:Uncharacterized protein n=1 Tax=Romanomermis culicivorax TaxID=13658 RepID=A0A915JPU9_ROMCU